MVNQLCVLQSIVVCIQMSLIDIRYVQDIRYVHTLIYDIAPPCDPTRLAAIRNTG
jgi:hypothetical protein